MRIQPLLLSVLGLCACAVSCVSPGARQMEKQSQVKLPEVNQASPHISPVQPAKRRPSALPQPAQPPVLTWDPQSRNLAWYYENRGDYNQDGEVNAADISQIVTFIGASQPFNETGLAAVADGDNNGEVNLADITTIVLNHLNRTNKYNVYSSASEDDIPPGPSAPNGPGAQLVSTVFLADAAAVAGQRKAFALQLDAGIDGQYYWVRAVKNNTEGLASNAVLVSLGAMAALVGQPLSGTAPLRVSLDGSLSSGGAGPITAYRWDFDGDGVLDLDSGTISVVEHIFNDPGNYIAKLTVATAGSVSQPATLPISVSPAGFEFVPWAETFIGGGAAGDFNITTTDLGGSVEVMIHSDNAIGLAALFGALSYDQDSFRFVENIPGNPLSLQGELLSFNQVASDSRLHFGHCMVLPQDKAGLFGDQLLATVVFAKEPEPPVGLVFRVPVDDASAVSDLTASRLDNTLIWRYNSNGDFNQDGIVRASDLAVLAYYWGLSGMFNQNSTADLADADGDMLISGNDILVLKEKYFQRITGFKVYGSSDPSDYPTSADEPNGTQAQMLGFLPQNAGVGDPIEYRLRYVFKVPGESMPDFLWVRPVLDGNEGVPSNLVEPSTEFFISPDWTDSDWDGVAGSGASTAEPLLLGQTGDGRTFSLIASTQPVGQGGLIDVTSLNWRVVPEGSGSIPEPGVLIPRSPIALGYIVADNGVGTSSNKLYFFAGVTPGG